MSEELEIVAFGNPPDGNESDTLVSTEPVELGLVPDADGELLLAQNQNEPEELLPIGTNGQKLTNIKSDQRIITIDTKPSVKTEADQQMSNLVNMVASLRSHHILCGKLEGVENSNSGEPRGILQYGDFKVLIPCKELMDIPENMRDMDPYDVMRYMISKRLGAEIEFVVLGIDQEAGLAVGSRKEAMKRRRKQFYFGLDKDGNNLLYEDAIAEARVMSAIRAGIFVEVFGVEAYIPASELSYQRILDCTKIYTPGQRVLVKLLSLDKNNVNDIQVILSVKQCRKDPYESLTTIYSIGNCYIGTVSMVDVNGVFVALDGGVDCRCPHPPRGVPVVGSRATVRLYRVDTELKRLSGDIIHVANTSN